MSYLETISRMTITFYRIPLPLKNKGYKFGNAILNESPESSPPPPPAPSQPPSQPAPQSAIPGLSNSMLGLMQGGGAAVNSPDLNVSYTDTGSSQYNRSGSVGSDLYGTSPAYSSAYLASRYGSTTTDHSPNVPRYASAYLNYATLQPQHMMMTSGSASASPHGQAPIATTQSTNVDHTSYYAPAHTTTRYTDYLRQHQAPAAAYGVSEATSPRWRRRSYDYDTNTMLGNVGGDYRRSMHGGGGLSATMVGSARSRSRTRGGNFASVGEYDTMASPYLRYTSPSTATLNDANSYNISSVAVSSSAGVNPATNQTRPMSGYIYGHSYGYHGGHVGSSIGNDGNGIGSGIGIASGASIVPHPPPGYNAKDREVSARIRRYQQPES